MAYSTCGKIGYRGCLHVEDHVQTALDDLERSGKAFVQVFKHSCNRKECPVCYESWAGLEASRIEHRLEGYSGKWRRVIHLSVNPEESFWSLSYPNLRSRVYKVLKQVGIVGGSVIFHPFRESEDGLWRFAPHFHVLGYGWHNGREIQGWVVKNHGVRKSVSGTAIYQLSHAGVHKSYHTITWFGCMSYNKLEVEPLVSEKPRCPLCDRKLVPLVFRSENGLDPPIEEGDFWLSVDDWYEKLGSIR
jgi:hypothetical protein